MTRRDVLLLILILLLGAGITVAHKVREGCLAPGVRVEGLEFLRGPLHTVSESADADWSDGDKVIVEPGSGDVQVLTWSEKKVHVELKKQLHGEKEEDAEKQASELKLSPNLRKRFIQGPAPRSRCGEGLVVSGSCGIGHSHAQA